MAGSDYDGDEFVVISDPQLVGNFAEAEAWEAPPPPSGVPGVKAANPNPNPNPHPHPHPNPDPNPNPNLARAHGEEEVGGEQVGHDAEPDHRHERARRRVGDGAAPPEGGPAREEGGEEG